MKPILLFLFLVFTTTVSTAQKIKFTDSTNIWWEQGMQTDDAAFLYHNYHYFGDSVINGERYWMMFDLFCTKKFPTQTNPYPTKNCHLYFKGFVREDTMAGIVYFGKYNSSVFSESILYDYNWQLNDSMATGKGAFKVTVFAIDSVIIGQDTHKVWQMRFFDSTSTGISEVFQIIEGIGNIDGLFHLQDGQPYFEGGTTLFCFRNNNANPSLNAPVDAFDNVSSCTLGVKEGAAVKTNKLAVIPHPANASSYIQFPHSFTGTISVYNNIGQLVVNEKISNAERWNLGNKIPVAGIYYYRIADGQTGNIYNGRFVYQ